MTGAQPTQEVSELRETITELKETNEVRIKRDFRAVLPLLPDCWLSKGWKGQILPFAAAVAHTLWLHLLLNVSCHSSVAVYRFWRPRCASWSSWCG